MEMKELMRRELRCGDSVKILLKNGYEISGTVEFMGDDLFQLVLSTGIRQPMTYDIVGTYQVTRCAQLDTGFENCTISLSDLQKRLKASNPELHKSLMPKLNSLDNAIRIKEVTAKFGRTPGILTVLINQVVSAPGNEYLLGLIGEVALMTEDKKFCLDALNCYDKNWSKTCFASTNLLRLLVRLSNLAENYECLRAHIARCPNEYYDQASKALLYLMDLLGICVDFPIRNKLDDENTIARLIHLVDGFLAEQAGTPSPPTPPVTVTLEPLQAVGTIFFYNESLRFGELKDEDNISYRFTLNNVNADARNQLQPGTQVLFFRTTVYSYKFQRNVGAADRISLLPNNALIKYPPPEQRITGYIILYMHHRRSGYIILEEDYRIKTKGDIFFETGDIIGNAFLDTRKNHYKVSFSYVNQLDGALGPKRAKNIQIIDRIPLEEDSQSSHGSLAPKSEDIDKLEITPGETLVVRDITNKLYLGDFVSRNDSSLVIQTQGQNRIFPYWDIKELMFFGLITSYNLLNETGIINGNYPFRSTNVTSTELSHLLRQNKYSSFLCIYSLLAADNNLYINNVDYLSDSMARQLVWRSGKIRGDYQARNYLSVDDQFRCYISSVKDSTLLNQFNPPESMAFMLQDVFYKVVRHKPADRPDNKGLLVQSILDIRAKYQQGKVNFHPSNPNSKKIQSGSYSYQCEQDLSDCENGTLGKLRLKLSDDNELVADYFDSRDLQLPNFYEGQANGESSSHTSNYEDDVFDSNLQLNNKKVMTLLEFSRDSFDYGRIRGYLPDTYAQMIRDGQFTGTLAEGRALVQMLRGYKSAGRKMPRKESWVDKIPPELRPELILAAAKIHHQLCNENTSDNFFSEEKSTKILVDYAWHHLTTGLVTEPAEVEYFSEIIFLNDFPSKTKNQMQARCLAEYFVGVKNTNLASYGERANILALLRRECTSVPGLSQMLMNLPQDTFQDLLDCIKSLKGHELLTTIAASFSGSNFAEKYTNESVTENCAEIVRTYYQAFNQKKLQFAHSISGEISINAVPILLAQIEEAEQGLGRYLFDDDRIKLERIRKIVNNISDTLMDENVVTQTAQLETAFGQLRYIVRDIEAQPSKFSFEVLRSFVRSLQNALVGHLNQQYLLYQPKLKIEHYSLSGDFRRETFCVSNAPHCLSAHNIRVSAVDPYGKTPGFIVDLEGNRQITGEGKSIAGGKGIEISIPIEVFDAKKKESLALSVSVSYERNAIFNPEISIPETEIQYVQEVNLQISLTSDDDAPLTSDDNPYRAYAGGKDMKPDGKAEKMFFGRQADIEKVYEMLLDDQGCLASGSIVAIYGQKRCGKTSVMNFLGKQIQEQFPDALILSVNAQNVTRENMYKGLLGEICVEFRRCWRRRPSLKADLKEAGLEIPSAGTMFSPGGESIFNAFFREFRAEFQTRYPIVLMVDEFTQAYILMKTGELSGDFLNRWRAMIQCNEFVNVVVGQDFMEKFTTDESITRLNYGGSVNGLGTMGRKRLSYLDFDSAREMMVEPIRNPNGTSRYQDILGEEAIKRIYDLTGGSAFYLMKFCNALVNYMIENNERLVYTSLVETVADSYVFDTPDNPITKTDFDPIYNAYSYDALSENAVIENMDEHAQEEMDKSYQMLKNIADNSNRLGVCNTSSIKWEDSEEKYHILQTLRIRGVLCDANGEEIKSENMENINVKIKVGLFSIWLKKRG